MKTTILAEFSESYRNFKNSYQLFTNLKPDFDNFFIQIKEMTDSWEQHEKLINENKQDIPIIIDLILHYKNTAIINQKIKNFLINEIEINNLEKEFTDKLETFYNNSRLLDLIAELEEQKKDVKKKMNLTHEFLQNNEVKVELKNNPSSHLLYPLIMNIKDINKFNDDFNTFQRQLQWLANNNIYNFYLMHKKKKYNLKFSETIDKFHIIVLKWTAKKEPNFTKINKESNNLKRFLYTKFLLLIFLNNFMVNIWKENSLALKKISNEIEHQDIEYLNKMQQLWLWMSNINSFEKVTIEEFHKIIMFYQSRSFNKQKSNLFLNNKISSEFKTTKNFPNIFYNFISENIDTISKLDNFKICFNHWPESMLKKANLIDKGKENFIKEYLEINSEKNKINEELAKYAYEVMRIFNDYLQIHANNKKLQTEITDPQQKFIHQLQKNQPNLFEEFKKIIKILEDNKYSKDSAPSLADQYINISQQKNQNLQR